MAINNDRKNEVLESYKAYKESKALRESKYEEVKKTTANKKAEFLKEYYKIREKRELSIREHGKLLEAAKNYYFGNALKGIYIAALEAETLTDDALYLAENMVDSYIKENGGYQAIMGNVKADTYLLAKIRRVVEDAAEEEVKNIEDGNKEIDEVEDIELQDSPEDEKDSIEVSGETKLTTANINDIVNALNQAGLEVVKKGEDADNFEEAQPETPETKPDMEIEDNQEETTTATTTEEEPAETTTAEPEDNTEETTTATTEEEPAEDTKDDSEFDKDMGSIDDTESEESVEDAETEHTEDKAEEESPEEDAVEDEFDKDLEIADKNNEEKEEDFDDTIDPDAVKVQDSEDDEDIQIDDSEEEGEKDSDDEDYPEDDDQSDADFEEGEAEETSQDDEGIDIDGDGDPDVGDLEEPEETVNVDPNKTMMDELENEKEIKDAVELIRTRVANAEEAFIKRNQEDKQKIDDLLSKISKNVATVEKISSEDGEDSKEVESAKKSMEESTLMYKKQINSIRDDKPMSIFEKMTRSISESIIRDPRKVNMFINEATQTPDFGLITETSKVMYGFLETLNTLQLESVNSKYILNIINNIR